MYDKAILECYRLLYFNATPSANFDLLVENALLNSQGQKVINYDLYEIEQDIFDKIIIDVIKKHKIKKGYRGMFERTILFGCSPKFKKDVL
tara:strand:- start:41 stop:313 length:273 start_codon:yes stop_codon:yes gene_type:complete